MATRLCPSQQKALETLLRAAEIGSIGVVFGKAGMGRSTVLREAHAKMSGAWLSARELADASRAADPLALEESFFHMMMQALHEHERVFVDDLDLLAAVVDCHHFYNRKGFLNAPLTALAAYAAEAKKKLFFATSGNAPAPIHARCYYAGIERFDVADYEFLCRQYLEPASADGLDFAQIHRFAPKLNAHQLKGAAMWLRDKPELSTDFFVEYLRSQRMASNVSLGEVRAVDLRDLKGVDDVIESLEANIILPLANDALATELSLKPRRGVLLVGPPGTGKTTIGRALAHRLKSKFFLIDGTFISGTREFYGRIREVFEVAKQNAPSIIFIDDSDAIFESGEELGLYRYLLTMLDGLESESAGRVCVMMTAMDVGHLPPALIRSGRIELWLETRLPDEDARAAILSGKLARLPASMSGVEAERVVEATEGFTGADLDRLIEDGKALFGFDRARGREMQLATEYFLAAVQTVRSNKERYAQAEALAQAQKSARSPFADFLGSMAAAEQADD